jgi:hypothetical protein
VGRETVGTRAAKTVSGKRYSVSVSLGLTDSESRSYSMGRADQTSLDRGFIDRVVDVDAGSQIII